MIAPWWRRASVILLSATILTTGAQAKKPTIVVIVTNDGPSCAARFQKADRDLPADFKAAAHVLHDRQPNAHIHVKAGIETRWECVGGAMTKMAEAGFTDIGFIAQPDPDQR